LSSSHSITSANLVCLFLVTFLNAITASLRQSALSTATPQKFSPFYLGLFDHTFIPMIFLIPTFALHQNKRQLNHIRNRFCAPDLLAMPMQGNG
jgi:hypothetical protein